MTPTELENVLRQIDFQSFSDEELSSFHALLSLHESKIRWLLNCRKHYKTHFHPENKKAD